MPLNFTLKNSYNGKFYVIYVYYNQKNLKNTQKRKKASNNLAKIIRINFSRT